MNSNLNGIWKSADSGKNWEEIAPASNGMPGSFDPFDVGGGGQGLFDNVIVAVKGNPERLILGGIDAYTWSTNGNWEQISQWFLPETNPLYLHADQHEMVWDQAGRLYVGNDGGIFFSDDFGQTFHEADRGYNVAQFYTVGFSAHGDVIGGTQDNGTLANYHDNETWLSHNAVGGGDGFSADISFINRNLLFGSVYYSYVFRSSDRGQTSSPFMPAEFSPTGALGCNPGSAGGDGCGQFFTNFALWENPNDLQSTDSVNYIPDQAYDAGDLIEVPSKSTQTYIHYTTPSDVVFDEVVDYDPAQTTFDTLIKTIAPSITYNLSLVDYYFVSGSHPIQPGDEVYIVSLDTVVTVLTYSLTNHYWGTNPLRPGKLVDMGSHTQINNVAWDTLRVQDPYQSWFAIGLGGANGVWMTRNALRFNAPQDEWFLVADGIDEVSSMEFSRNGNELFIGTWTGDLYRLSGFGNVYSPAKHNDISNGIYADTLIDLTTPGGPKATSFSQIGSFGAPVTGIAVEQDPDHVVITLGNFSGTGKVRECLNATGGVPTWSIISGNLPALTTTAMPLYSVVIDRDDPDKIIVGGEYGVFYTENGGAMWENCSGDFGRAPVFDMGQNWRTWNEGCYRPGEIYIGTHGRGIWTTDAYLSLPGQLPGNDQQENQVSLRVYPNPVSTSGTVRFYLDEPGDAQLYIFNLNGQLVQQFKYKNAVTGQQEFTFDATQLPAGTYIVQLVAGNTRETVKFIKN